MIPSDFYDDKDPEDENFEPTGNAGVQADRQYSDEDAIVVWPKSRGWEVITDGDISKMITYYEEHAADEDMTWRMEKIETLSKKVNTCKYRTRLIQGVCKHVDRRQH